MDSLDRILVPARDLLGRVDATLRTQGAPPDHPVLPLLKKIRAFPGEALESVAELDARTVADVAVELRVYADRYAGHRAGVEHSFAATRWEGAARETFAGRWRSLGRHLGDGESPREPSMAGRLVALLTFLDGVGDWITETRAGLATAIAESLGSTEAVCLRSAPAPAPTAAARGPDRALAASSIGVRVLGSIDTAVLAGYRLYGRRLPDLTELVFLPPGTEPPPADHLTASV